MRRIAVLVVVDILFRRHISDNFQILKYNLDSFLASVKYAVSDHFRWSWGGSRVVQEICRNHSNFFPNLISQGEIRINSTNCTKLHSHCGRLPCHVLPNMPAGNVRCITFHWLRWIIFWETWQENRPQLITRPANSFNSKSKDIVKFSNLCSRQ